MKPKSENRRHPRKTAYIIAEYTVREGTFRDIIKNIGAEGFFIRTNRKVAQGQPISVSFPLFDFDNLIAVKGIVARNEPGGFAISLDTAIEGWSAGKGIFQRSFMRAIGSGMEFFKVFLNKKAESLLALPCRSVNRDAD